MDLHRLARAIVAAAAEDARLARAEFDDARRWFVASGEQHREPLGAEVWLFDPAFGHVLLIETTGTACAPTPGRPATGGEAEVSGVGAAPVPGAVGSPTRPGVSDPRVAAGHPQGAARISTGPRVRSVSRVPSGTHGEARP